MFYLILFFGFVCLGREVTPAACWATPQSPVTTQRQPYKHNTNLPLTRFLPFPTYFLCCLCPCSVRAWHSISLLGANECLVLCSSPLKPHSRFISFTTHEKNYSISFYWRLCMPRVCMRSGPVPVYCVCVCALGQ